MQKILRTWRCLIRSSNLSDLTDDLLRICSFLILNSRLVVISPLTVAHHTMQHHVIVGQHPHTPSQDEPDVDPRLLQVEGVELSAPPSATEIQTWRRERGRS